MEYLPRDMDVWTHFDKTILVSIVEHLIFLYFTSAGAHKGTCKSLMCETVANAAFLLCPKRKLKNK